jgi:CBS domain-containing protein
MRISHLFGPSEVFFPPPGLDETAIVRELLDRLQRAGKLGDAETALQTLVERKCCSVEAMATDIAVVHVKLQTVNALCVAVAIADDGIHCECLTPEVVQFRVLILVLTPLENLGGYIRVAATTRRLLVQPDIAQRLRSAQTPEAVWQVFDSTEATLPDHATAGDIMREEIHTLRDTDSLTEAIDAFCTYNLSELPVVDKDGDLVGVVSEDELLRICLPEYITWTEDLTGIVDFEPFAEVLRREQDMPIVEIMLFSDRYAAVDVSTPAVQVAKIMMRNDVKQVLVTQGSRLVGLISLSDFIRKVLRA